MYDIDFDFFPKVANTYARTAARRAVLVPLFGRSSPARAVHQTEKLVGQWRARLASLHTAGWQRSLRDPLSYYTARNCWPTFAMPQGRATRCCRLWFCPFCWGRQVVDAYERFDAFYPRFYQSTGDSDWVVRTYTERQERNREDYPCAVEEAVATMQGLVLRRQRATRRIRPRGGFQLWTLAPHGFSAANALDEPPEAAAREDLSFRVAQFFWRGYDDQRDFPRWDGNIREYRELSRSGMVPIVAALFRYPVAWLRSDPDAMLTLIEARERHRVRTCEWTGEFRNHQYPAVIGSPGS